MQSESTHCHHRCAKRQQQTTYATRRMKSLRLDRNSAVSSTKASHQYSIVLFRVFRVFRGFQSNCMKQWSIAKCKDRHCRRIRSGGLTHCDFAGFYISKSGRAGPRDSSSRRSVMSTFGLKRIRIRGGGSVGPISLLMEKRSIGRVRFNVS